MNLYQHQNLHQETVAETVAEAAEAAEEVMIAGIQVLLTKVEELIKL